MFPYKFYEILREEQRELALRIGRLEQFIDDHDNKGMNKELNDDYMDLLRDQLESMKDYNTCLVQRIGLAVTEGIEPATVQLDAKKFREACAKHKDCVCGKAMDNKPEHELGDKVDPDKIVSDEDERNFGFHSWVGIFGE